MENKNKTLKIYNKQKKHIDGGLVNNKPPYNYNRNLTNGTDEISGVKEGDAIKFEIKFYKHNDTPNITHTHTRILFYNIPDNPGSVVYLENTGSKWNENEYNYANFRCTVVCIMKVIKNQNGGGVYKSNNSQSNLSFVLDKIEIIDIDIRVNNNKINPIIITDEQILKKVKKSIQRDMKESNTKNLKNYEKQKTEDAKTQNNIEPNAKKTKQAWGDINSQLNDSKKTPPIPMKIPTIPISIVNPRRFINVLTNHSIHNQLDNIHL